MISFILFFLQIPCHSDYVKKNCHLMVKTSCFYNQLALGSKWLPLAKSNGLVVSTSSLLRYMEFSSGTWKISLLVIVIVHFYYNFYTPGSKSMAYQFSQGIFLNEGHSAPVNRNKETSPTNLGVKMENCVSKCSSFFLGGGILFTTNLIQHNCERNTKFV